MITKEDLNIIKKHEKYINLIYVTDSGFKLSCCKTDKETGISIYYNIVIYKVINFNLRQSGEDNICKTISFEYGHNRITRSLASWRELLELESVNIWPKNCSQELTGYTRQTVIAYFKDKAMYSEVFEIPEKKTKISSDHQFSFWKGDKVLKDDETIRVCNA